MRTAIKRLYGAGHWECLGLNRDEAMALWEEARDAAGIPVGTERARLAQQRAVLDAEAEQVRFNIENVNRHLKQAKKC